MEDFTVLPAGQGEPEVAVPASAAARAAELLALAAELADTCRDGVIRARIEALMEAKGAEPAGTTTEVGRPQPAAEADGDAGLAACPACPHCRKPVALVAWLVPPAAATVREPPRHAERSA